MSTNPWQTHITSKEIVILYVEDQPHNYEEMFSLIQEHCNERSRHVKSLDSACAIIESGELEPHFAILDRKILHYDKEGTVPDNDAGDMLYAFLVSCHIPVVLMTANDPSELATQNPYRSKPPVLGYMSKLSNEASLHDAVGRYLTYRKELARDGNTG